MQVKGAESCVTNRCLKCARLRGKVHHGVDALRAQHVAQQVAALQVALDELVAGVRGHRLQVVERAAVVQLVQDNDLPSPRARAQLFEYPAR